MFSKLKATRLSRNLSTRVTSEVKQSVPILSPALVTPHTGLARDSHGPEQSWSRGHLSRHLALSCQWSETRTTLITVMLSSVSSSSLSITLWLITSESIVVSPQQLKFVKINQWLPCNNNLIEVDTNPYRCRFIRQASSQLSLFAVVKTVFVVFCVRNQSAGYLHKSLQS